MLTFIKRRIAKWGSAVVHMDWWQINQYVNEGIPFFCNHDD